MRICVFGAGGLGAFLGARIAAAGAAEVSLVDRGAHLAALRAQGVGLIEAEGERRIEVAATDDPATLGPQDYVLLAVRAAALPEALPALASLLGPETCVVAFQGGMPWWYFHRHAQVYDALMIEAVDPLGIVWTAIGPERVLGCVATVAAEVVAPGMVRHFAGDAVHIGEPSGEISDRARRLAPVLEAAGLRVSVEARIRSRLWEALWPELAFGPISALTETNAAVLAADAGTRGIAAGLLGEAAAVAAQLGIDPPDPSRVIATAAVAAPLPAMLRDLTAGRPLEIAALLGTLREMGVLTRTPTPPSTGSTRSCACGLWRGRRCPNRSPRLRRRRR